MKDVERISWAINKVAMLVPFRADCLVKSIAAFRILKRWGLAPTFRIGVSLDADGRFLSHAYTECEGIVVNWGSVDHLSTIVEGHVAP